MAGKRGRELSMAVKIGEIIDLMSSKNGDELFEKITEILGRFGIKTTCEDGAVKDLQTLCYEMIETWKKGDMM